jgi:hypothetical protein
MPTRLAHACLALALAATLAACGWVPSARYKATVTATATHQPAAPVDATTENGAITISKGTGPGVQVTAAVRAATQERAQAVTISAQPNDLGVLVVRVNWPGGKREPNEGCSLDITVPGASGLALTTSNGSIRATGLAGPATLSTSNGSVRVTNHDGTVHAKTSNGSVTLEGVTGAAVDTSNGSVTVRLTPGASGPVNIDTSNGSITLAVGSAFAGKVQASTSNGRVSDQTGRSKSTSRNGRSDALFDFGDGPQSVLDSSNGSITIQPAE